VATCFQQPTVVAGPPMRPALARPPSRLHAVGLAVIAALFGILTAACSSSGARDQAQATHVVHTRAAAVSTDTTTTEASTLFTPTVPDRPLDRATHALLAEQLTIARATALRYPTVRDAEAAGYTLIGGFGPGSGAHYIGGFSAGSGSFDPSRPQALLYSGTNSYSPVVGLMYYAMGDKPPAGFAGPNDRWHRHTNVCTTRLDGKIGVPFAPDRDVTPAQCGSVGGQFQKITGWMVHAWVVPSWESPAGVFSHENPDLPCVDGTFNTDKVGACKGI
jgi:hypothetical protein